MAMAHSKYHAMQAEYVLYSHIPDHLDSLYLKEVTASTTN